MSSPTVKFDQRGHGWMAYPARHSFLRLFYKAPLLQYRLGLGPLLHRFFCMLVLTTRGRKSGRARYTMLEHTWHNGRAYIAPGWGDRTLWYQNILDDPRVTVQRGGTVYGAVAFRVTDNAELAGLYRVMARESSVWKQYLASWGIEDTLDDYLAKKDRLVVLRLDPTTDVSLRPLRRDLIWLWPVVVVAVGAWAVLR
jgi:deazaflavin-dependent oxidoreductase (nitroreductase family)